MLKKLLRFLLYFGAAIGVAQAGTLVYSNIPVPFPHPFAISDTTGSTSSTTGSLTTAGGLGVGGAIFATGNVNAAAFVPTSSAVPTNGVYLPATNAVGIATNTANRVYIDPNGNVGIGTTAPNALLSLKAQGNVEQLNIYDGAPALRFGFGVQSNELQEYIASGSHFSWSGGGDLNATGTNEWMRLNSNNLGVFTTTPGSALQVNGAACIGQLASCAAPANSVEAIGAFVHGGNAPTASGTCLINTQVGGNTAGSFKANGACAGGTVILTFSATAPNGWVCDAHDMTTTADLLNQTAYTATSCTFTGSMASLDQVTFRATAF